MRRPKDDQRYSVILRIEKKFVILHMEMKETISRSHQFPIRFGIRSVSASSRTHVQAHALM